MHRIFTQVRGVQNTNIKDKIKDILSFYESKKISQFATAKNLIKSFTSKDEKKIKKAEENFKKHQEAKPIDERMKEKYTRVERKNMDKPQSSIKFKISQKTPDFSEALITLKKKFIKEMNDIFKTRPNYRICLGVNADFTFDKSEANARVGTKDPLNQINPEYIKVNKEKEIDTIRIFNNNSGQWVYDNPQSKRNYEELKNEADEMDREIEIEKAKVIITTITFKTKAEFIYNKKEIAFKVGRN